MDDKKNERHEWDQPVNGGRDLEKRDGGLAQDQTVSFDKPAPRPDPQPTEKDD